MKVQDTLFNLGDIVWVVTLAPKRVISDGLWVAPKRDWVWKVLAKRKRISVATIRLDEKTQTAVIYFCRDIDHGAGYCVGECECGTYNERLCFLTRASARREANVLNASKGGGT